MSPGWGLHYNPATIQAELEAAAAGDQSEGLFGEFHGDASKRFRDLLRHEVWASTAGELAARRGTLKRAAADAFASAGALVVTYGLAEICEIHTGHGWRIVNRDLHGCQTAWNTRSRFMTVEEVAKCTAAILAAARRMNPSLPVFFTVSPVPLIATRAGCDPRIANQRSKSTLLVGLHCALEKASGPVHYFPAYEMFGPGVDMPALFQADARHPTAAAVQYVAESFWRQFGDDSLDDVSDFDVPVPAMLAGEHA